MFSDNVVDKHVNACHFQAGGMFHFVLYAVGNALGDGGNVQTIPHFDMQCDDQTAFLLRHGNAFGGQAAGAQGIAHHAFGRGLAHGRNAVALLGGLFH